MFGVLIAEESKVTRARISEMLSPLSVAVYFEAANGDRALEVARRYRPDLIILDMMLPGIHGIEVCNTIKADPTLSAIPVILLIPCDDPAYRYLARQAKADGFVSRPFDKEALLSRVTQVMPILA